MKMQTTIVPHEEQNRFPLTTLAGCRLGSEHTQAPKRSSRPCYAQQAEEAQTRGYVCNSTFEKGSHTFFSAAFNCLHDTFLLTIAFQK